MMIEDEYQAERKSSKWFPFFFRFAQLH
jgi:hypothetical protein